MIFKKVACVLFILLISPIYINAESIDFPYYMGLVAADGSTTINDGNWQQSHEFGQNHPVSGWDGRFESTEAQAVRSLNNGAVAILYWWYNTNLAVPAWVLEDSDVFKVTQNSIVYYGGYKFNESQPFLIDNPQRIKRLWKTGESIQLTKTMGSFSMKESISFERVGVTLNEHAVPGSSPVTDCAILHFHQYDFSYSSTDFEYSTSIFAPGKGEIVNMNYESEADEIGVDSKDEVTAWGTSVDYPDYMSLAMPPALVILNGLALSDDNIVDVKPTGNTKVVVVPIN
ncbi:MAG: hypothetical protein GY699_17885 [Desulfobacteraceae bacterium]|nr:hypothetical protein [Desulfobacteraceae bacterium]